MFVDFQDGRSVLFPVAQYNPRKSVVAVDVLAVGMAVYQQVRSVSADRFGHSLRVDVHDFGRFALFVLLAGLADFFGDADSQRQRQQQKQLLPPFLVHFAAELLVADIVRTQGVAVADERFPSEQINRLVFGQQNHAGFRGETFAEQEIAVAVDKIAFHPASGQMADGLFDRIRQDGAFVIAYPKVKQVAEYVNRLRFFRLAIHKVQEEFGQVRAGFAQVQVGNEINGHG